MEFKTIEWNREKLYEQIWTTPLRTVAKEYGLSDVGLAKICKKLRIPKPGLGYWRRRECGYKVSQPPLPTLSKESRLVSHFPVESPQKPVTVQVESLPALRTPSVNSPPHPLVKQTRQAFANGRTDQFGRLHLSNYRIPHFDLRVTASGMERALEFVNELMQLLEANDMSFRTTEADHFVATIAVDGEQIKVVLREHVRGRKRDLNAAERREQERWPNSYSKTFRMEFNPTNQFVFEIESYSDSQHTWVDNKSRPIEQCFVEIAHGVRAAAACAKRRRAERLVEQELQLKAERIRLKQQARIERLKSNLSNWEEAQRIRTYLNAVRQNAEARGDDMNEGSPASRYLAWGHRYADYLDPSGAPFGPEWSETEP